jgi:hypothetical protein
VQPIDTIRRDLPKRYAAALMRAMATSPRRRFRSYDAMLVELQLPRSKPFRFASLVLIGAGLAVAGYAVWHDPDWKWKLSAVATALKAEIPGTDASAAAVEPSDAGGADGLVSVEVPPPEETSWVATALAEPDSQPNSESAPGLEAQLRSEPGQSPGSVVEPEASPQAPAQSASAVSATLPAEADEQSAAITQSSSATTQSSSGSSSSVDASIDEVRNQ